MHGPVLTLRARRIFLLAALVWLGFALYTIFLSPVSVSSLEQKLEAQANEALRTREHGWAQVSVIGQVATLTGAAPNETIRGAAENTVSRSTWSGGVVAGGITHVVDETSAARFERGFSFRADLLNGRVLIRGDASDSVARDAITRFANLSFPGGADTDLTLVPGGSPGSEWEDTVKRLLGQLARLENGAVVLTGQQGGLIGDAANPQIAQSVASVLSSTPPPFRAASLVFPSGAPNVVSILDHPACAAVIQAAEGWNALRFDLGGDSPNPLSQTVLRRMGQTFQACPAETRLSVVIDLSNDDEVLASGRAEAVMELLVDGGADDMRIDVSYASDQLRVVAFEITMAEG